MSLSTRETTPAMDVDGDSRWAWFSSPAWWRMSMAEWAWSSSSRWLQSPAAVAPRPSEPTVAGLRTYGCVMREVGRGMREEWTSMGARQDHLGCCILVAVPCSIQMSWWDQLTSPSACTFLDARWTDQNMPSREVAFGKTTLWTQTCGR